MISAWFNERGYLLSSKKGHSHFIYDLSPEFVNNAMTLYSCRWMILNHLLDAIKQLGETTLDKDLTLHTDSRLVEELQGELTPQNEFALSSRQYFMKHDYGQFRRVLFVKCTSSTINDRLNQSSVSSTRHR